MFNLAYRKQSKISDPKGTANNVINYINDEIKQRLDKDGVIYLTFDPIPKSDLGMRKNFKYNNFRASIKRDYKAHRVTKPDVMVALQLLQKYYAYRGSQIKTVISNVFEADDYVESLIKKNNTGMTALISNDMDWARYISDKVQMINTSFEFPITKQNFFEEKGYLPTEVAITLTKAIFGDPSDNIEPVLTKKNKIYKDSTDFIKALIKEISKTDITMEQVNAAINGTKTIKLLENENRNFLDEILSLISVSNDAFECFKRNIRLIKSRCDDVDKYISFKKDNPSYNKLMETLLCRQKQTSQKFNFGNITIN